MARKDMASRRAHYICSDGAIVESRAIRLLPAEESWSLEKVQAIKATPWCLCPEEDEDAEAAAPEVIRVEHADPSEPVATAKDPEARGVRIEVSDLTAFGYTKGCRKCDILLSGTGAQPSLGHTPACRPSS